MVEKRIHQRSPIELAASFGIEEDPRPEHEAKISNISNGGFCFSSDHALKVKQEINLAIDLDATDETIIAVKVVWVEKEAASGKYIVGVQIVENDGPEFERFAEFYSKQF